VGRMAWGWRPLISTPAVTRSCFLLPRRWPPDDRTGGRASGQEAEGAYRVLLPQGPHQGGRGPASLPFRLGHPEEPSSHVLPFVVTPASSGRPHRWSHGLALAPTTPGVGGLGPRWPAAVPRSAPAAIGASRYAGRPTIWSLDWPSHGHRGGHGASTERGGGLVLHFSLLQLRSGPATLITDQRATANRRVPDRERLGGGRCQQLRSTRAPVDRLGPGDSYAGITVRALGANTGGVGQTVRDANRCVVPDSHVSVSPAIAPGSTTPDGLMSESLRPLLRWHDLLPGPPPLCFAAHSFAAYSTLVIPPSPLTFYFSRA